MANLARMDVIAIRHRNFLLLLEQLKQRGITKTKDAAQALGGLGSSYFSQLKGGKLMGDATARRIEAAIYKPRGWMDRPQWADHQERIADHPEVDKEEAIRRLMELLPADERALLENYRAAGDAGKTVVEAAAAAVAQPARTRIAKG